MSPFEHGEVFVLDDGGEVKKSSYFELFICHSVNFASLLCWPSGFGFLPGFCLHNNLNGICTVDVGPWHW